MISESLHREFESIVGAKFVRSTDCLALPRSWTTPPDLEVSPGTVSEVIAAVAAAEAAAAAMIPTGGATQLGTGYPPAFDRPQVLLSTRRLNSILDHQPDDLTITCEAGVTVAQAEQALKQHNQTLALDGPLPDAATLGGMVAAATAGHRRIAYGTPRDTLIGMRAVMTGGIAVHGGGKVVKNVAGYDVCKLFTGSWGSLGVLTEVTFKVRPLPEVTRRLAWLASDTALALRTGFKLHLARLAPTAILSTSDFDGSPALIICLEGAAERVEWQAAEASRKVAEEGLAGSIIDISHEQWTDLNNWSATTSAISNAAARIACLPADLADVADVLSGIPGAFIFADCAVGTVHLSLCDANCEALARVRSALPKNANCVWTVLDLTGDCASTTPRWGDLREERLLQSGIKAALDPLDTFSPGRFQGR